MQGRIAPMPRTARRTLLGCLLGLLACGLAACGDDPVDPAGAGQTPPAEDAPWSAPAPVEGLGSPDGESSAIRSAESVLAGLRERIADGRGHSDPTFDKDVQDVAAVLWEPTAQGAAAEAAQVHVQVASIAGEVGRWLARSETARVERAASNPTDLALHDAFLEAAGKGPEVYRAWCGDAGAKLLEKHAEAAYLKHFPPRSKGK